MSTQQLHIYDNSIHLLYIFKYTCVRIIRNKSASVATAAIATQSTTNGSGVRKAVGLDVIEYCGSIFDLKRCKAHDLKRRHDDLWQASFKVCCMFKQQVYQVKLMSFGEFHETDQIRIPMMFYIISETNLLITKKCNNN